MQNNLPILFTEVKNRIPLEEFKDFKLELLKDNSVVNSVKVCYFFLA